MELIDRVLVAVPASLPEGRRALIALPMQGDAYLINTYSTDPAAWGQVTRAFNRGDCPNMYVVRKHRGGTTVFYGPNAVLGTVKPPTTPETQP